MSEFNESEFALGWTHAENGSSLPKTASKDFLEGYIANLEPVVSQQAPGYDVVAPAFEAPTPGINNSQSDYTDAKPATDDGQYKEIRNDLATKVDRDNAAGQSRGNGSLTDLSGWKTSALLKELTRRTAALEGPKA